MLFRCNLSFKLLVIGYVLQQILDDLSTTGEKEFNCRVGRNAIAYIVTWDEMLQRFPTFADLDGLYNFLNYDGSHVLSEAKSWLTIYPLPWELFVWKAAFCDLSST